jgi:Zn-dependent peptidase ImmA (M78 family)
MNQTRTKQGEAKLSSKLSDFMGSFNLDAWVDVLITNFLDQTKQTYPPFHLYNYLQYRKIKSCTDNTNICVRGKINTERDGFRIEFNSNLLSDKAQFRFTIAHEIAHTFFYDIQKSPPINVSGLTSDSKYIEQLCNKIARNLLIPGNSIKSIIAQFPFPLQQGFSLNVLSKLSTIYQVNFSILLRRIIFDEELWRCVFLRFRYIDEKEWPWKLIEHYKPKSIHYNKDYYVPSTLSIYAIARTKKWPSAKKGLHDFLNTLYSQNEPYHSLTMEVTTLYHPPMLTLVKKIYQGKKEITLYAYLQKDAGIINLCLPY